MTRQDFAAIAETIKNLHLDESDREHVARSFAIMLVDKNPRFDHVRFLKACEVTK